MHPDEVRPAERLAIACTQTGLTASRQKSLVREWCRILPQLEGVRFLWLVTRVPQNLFDAACQVPQLEGLYVKWSGVKSLEAVRGARDLRHFHLGSSPGLESIDPISGCSGLETLGFENIKQIQDLGPVASMGGLRQLAVEGSTWTTQQVETLEPVGSLADLRYLSIVNLRALDGTLRPLFSLRRLERFLAAQWWDAGEVAELRRLNPALRD